MVRKYLCEPYQIVLNVDEVKALLDWVDEGQMVNGKSTCGPKFDAAMDVAKAVRACVMTKTEIQKAKTPKPDPVELRNWEEEYPIGTRVRATQTITECGDHPGNPMAPFPDPYYIHAREGDEGVVEHVEPNVLPTVRFDRTGTASLVTPREIEKVSEEGTKNSEGPEEKRTLIYGAPREWSAGSSPLLDRNRIIFATLEQVLDTFIAMSGANHPHDVIDKETAIISVMTSSNGEPEFVISWDGFPSNSPDYHKGPSDE